MQDIIIKKEKLLKNGYRNLDIKQVENTKFSDEELEVMDSISRILRGGFHPGDLVPIIKFPLADEACNYIAQMTPYSYEQIRAYLGERNRKDEKVLEEFNLYFKA